MFLFPILQTYSQKKITLWSQFENLMTFYKNYNKASITNHIIENINLLDESDFNMIIKDQFKLNQYSQNNRRNSVFTIIKSFQIFNKSRSTYCLLRSLFCLPSLQYLNGISFNFKENDYVAFLKKAQFLTIYI